MTDENTNHIYVLIDRMGFIGAFSTQQKAEVIVETYKQTKMLITKYDLNPEVQKEKIWFLPWLDLNQPIAVSNDKEYVFSLQYQYKQLDLTYPDPLEYYERTLDEIGPVEAERLDNAEPYESNLPGMEQSVKAKKYIRKGGAPVLTSELTKELESFVEAISKQMNATESTATQECKPQQEEDSKCDQTCVPGEPLESEICTNNTNSVESNDCCPCPETKIQDPDRSLDDKCRDNVLLPPEEEKTCQGSVGEVVGSGVLV